MTVHEKKIPTFATERRIHFGVPVRDLERSVSFYRTLFGVAPSKERAGYARFEVSNPPVHLGLTESRAPISDSLSHYGIQVKSEEAVASLAGRLETAGYATTWERSVVCCHATQEKVWVHDPDGRAWEVYVVVDDEPDAETDAAGATSASVACCETESCGSDGEREHR